MTTHTTTLLDTPTSLTKRTCTDRFLSHLAVHTYIHDTATATHSAKGQLISKCFLGVVNFLQKTNKNKST